MPIRTADLDDDRIGLIEETLAVGKQSVETGRVRVDTVVETENLLLQERLASDAIEIERVARDERVDAAPAVREEGDTLIVPVVEERLVVVRQLFLVEEVRIRRSTTEQSVEIPASRRVMRAVVTRDDITNESENRP